MRSCCPCKMLIFRVCFLFCFAILSAGKQFGDKTSRDGLVTRFDDLVYRFKQEFNQIIQEERKKMQAELEAFNAYKKRFNVSNDDIIQLNVGGQKFTTTRSTLSQVNGSLLATMFSGSMERGLKHDQDGAVVLDFNPEHFGWILNYLRAKKISTPEKFPVFPKVPQDERKNFNILLKYLGLSDEINLPIARLSEKFSLHGSKVSLQESGRVAAHDSSQAHTYVIGENVYQRGTISFKLKLESFQNNHWILVGIVKADVVPKDQNSYSWPGAYGWSLGNNGQLYEDGVQTGYMRSWKNLSKQGDTVELVLDCDGGKLSLHLPTGQQYHIGIPKSQSWRLHVNLWGAYDKIRIVEVVQD